jgi:hypothetical protein
MSDNKPHWVDYANLASNAAQNVQLHQVRSALQALAALDADRSLRELNEQQAREREDRLRQLIWEWEVAFDAYIQNPDTKPCARFILARLMIANLERLGVTVSSFRQFNDKDRFGGFFNQLQQVVEETSRSLSAPQRTEAETYLLYETELQALEESIKKEQEKNAEIDIKLAEVKERKSVAQKKLKKLRAEVRVPRNTDEAGLPIGRKALMLAKTGVALILVIVAALTGLIGIFALAVPLYSIFEGTPSEVGTFLGYGVGLLLMALIILALAEMLAPGLVLGTMLKGQISELEQQVKSASKAMVGLDQRRKSKNSLDELLRQR